MEDVDKKILEELTKDARTSFRKIAKMIDKSPDTIINHYEKLKKIGLIRGSTIIVNPQRINYEGMAAFQIDVSTDKTKKIDINNILDTLIKMPNIIMATKTVGDHDLLAIGVIHDFDHLMKINEEISEIKGIKNIQTSLWASGEEICSKYFIV
ncbi:Lrp/AsnC family transcriptional regulator [Candidatus Bathyarchaeota archaeon]|nr:Lrp/AsnC family transcriptional regulator [Candidatus Bathyarchaeota archaeon]